MWAAARASTEIDAEARQRTVSRRFRDLSIRHKLFITYFLLVVVSLCLFLAVSTYLVTKENERQAWRSAKHVFNQQYLAGRIEHHAHRPHLVAWYQ